jgi:hypothetical protein
MSDPKRRELVEAIPPAAVVRDRLARALRDVQLLRQLLKLAQRIEKHDQMPGAGHGR